MTQYAHRIWGQEEGLFQPTIYSILQTRDGFLWLGTQDSLIRFDGVHFREFADGKSVLHGSLIRSLMEDAHGNLWAGSLGGGLVKISPQGAVAQYSTHNGLPSDSVFCIARGANDSVWACTNEGLVRISGKRIRTFTTADGLPSKRIRAACETWDGTLWAAGLDYGLSRGSGSRFAPVSAKLIAPGRIVNALECAADGTVWAGTSNGLVHIEGTQSVSYSTRNGLPDNEILALAEGPAGAIWIGANDGISRLRNGEVSAYRTRDGLSHSQVLALALDREGTLWAGTKNGLDQFTDGKVTPYTTNEGLLSNDAGPVLEDNDGILWIGTLGRGLNSYGGHRFRALTTKDGLVSDTVLSLALDRSGDLWVGTNSGLNCVRNQKVVASYTAQNGLRGTEIRSLFVDRSGTLWVGTERGLDRFEGGRFQQTLPAPVLALTGGHTVPLFASLEGAGLYLSRADRLTPYPLETTHAIDCFFLDHLNHTIWMGTLGSGLLRWKNDSVTHIFVKDGLYDNRIYSILEDDKSNLWLASSKGIFRVSRYELEEFAEGKTKRVTSFPFTTGQLRFECRAGVQPAACRTRDGRLWFSTTSGLVVLDPNHLQANAVPPPSSITAMIVNGTRLSGSAEPHLWPHDPNNIEIRYAGLSFVSPEKVTFRYRLAGYDKTWIDAGVRREAFYTNLPPGTFDFRVEARNTDGLWSALPASLRFVVEPKLYQRRWFFPVLLLALGAFIVIGYRVRIRRLRSRFNLILAERNRIARELHDTLLQGLSGITMQLQAIWTRLPASPEKRSLGDVIQDAGRCSTEARQSLWGLRTGSPGGPDFSERLTQLARQAAADKNVSLVLRIEPVSLTDHPDTQYQLLRIAAEAIGNALQHSGARHLTIGLHATAALLSLSIEDDGLGFAASCRQVTGHFGIQGMRERATELGAELTVVSSPGAGTCVTLSCPVARESKHESNAEPVDAHRL